MTGGGWGERMSLWENCDSSPQSRLPFAPRPCPTLSGRAKPRVLGAGLRISQEQRAALPGSWPVQVASVASCPVV